MLWGTQISYQNNGPVIAAPMTKPGALDAPNAGVLNPTGTSRIITVPVGNSGLVRVAGLTPQAGGYVDFQVSINAAAYVSINSVGATFTCVTGQSCQIRATGCAAGDGVIVTLTDVDAAADFVLAGVWTR